MSVLYNLQECAALSEELHLPRELRPDLPCFLNGNYKRNGAVGHTECEASIAAARILTHVVLICSGINLIQGTWLYMDNLTMFLVEGFML